MATAWVEGPAPDRISTYGSHSDQIVEFYGQSGPLIAMIHGGYWRAIHNREHMRALACKIADHGFQVANIEYRREPLKPKETFDDVTMALNSLGSIEAIIGFSVGGQIALLNATLAHKLILLAPVTDLERTKSEELGDGAVKEFFGFENLQDFDPMKLTYSSHIYLLHGDNDQRVPIWHSRDFVKSKGGSLMEIAGADHFEVINPEGLAFQLILNALK